MPQAATIKSLPRAFRMMKTMQAQGIEWGEDYRRAGALALKDVLEGRMAAGVDRHLDEMAERGRPAQRQLPPLADDGAGRDRAQRPAHAELERARGGARLRPARGPHRPHPLRRLHPRKLKPGSANPLLPDTNLLTLPGTSLLFRWPCGPFSLPLPVDDRRRTRQSLERKTPIARPHSSSRRCARLGGWPARRRSASGWRRPPIGTRSRPRRTGWEPRAPTPTDRRRRRAAPSVDVRNIAGGRHLGPGAAVDVAGEGVLINHDARETWVEFIHTDQHFSGRRCWFSCPECDCRCAILYRRHGYFGCRKCHDLAYESQRLSRSDRLTLACPRLVVQRLS